MTEDHRRRVRVPIDKNVTLLSDDGNPKAAHLTDISSSGAAVEFNLSKGDSPFQFDLGQHVDLEPDDMSALSGEVVRVYDKGVAVNFDLDEINEDQLISEIMSVQNNIPLKDE